MYAVIFITAAHKKEAESIAQGLIRNKLAACVNIVAGVDSLFWWKGRVERTKEALLIVKTRRSLINRLIKKVRALHSYEVPEIIALPIIAGNKKYLDWLNESTR